MVKSEEKEIGIEVTRICSMWMIVIVHILGSGGLLENLPKNSTIYTAMWCLRIMVRPAPLIFAIISGYLMISKSFKASRIFTIWKQVLFWDILIFTGMSFIRYLNGEKISFYEVIPQIFPVYKGAYWYVTSYIGLLIVMPFINALVKNMDKIMYLKCILAGYILFSFLPNILSSDVFGLNYGYGVLYLAYVYFIGGYFKYYGKKFEFWKSISILIVVTILTFVLKKQCIIDLELNMNSPTLLLIAISVFIITKNIDIKNVFCRKMILYVAPSAFSVYLIHCNTIILNCLIKGKFIFLSEFGTIKALIFVFVLSGIINVVCLLLDIIFRRTLCKLPYLFGHFAERTN